MSIIEVENLCHRFSDGTLVLDDITLSISEGEFVVLAGANGCGKTTLFRHFNGLLPAQKGSVRVDGISVAKNPARARQKVGMVFQEADSQIVGETVFDDVAFGPENLGLSGRQVEARVTAALETVQMTEFSEHRPHQLSGGEKRRVAIAGILAMNSEVLVFDEPFSNLDYPGVRQVLTQIVALNKAGHTIVMATHDLSKVLAQASRLLVMAAGRIVRDGRPEEAVRGVERYGVREPFASRRQMELSSWLS
ncbi:MAG: ABC transporter ATP-binding protein [Desulfosalsimonadaceae bacterium]